MLRTALQWIDAAGDERLTYLASTSGAPFTQAALLAMSCASLTGTFSGSLLQVVGPTANYATYPSIGNMTALDTTDPFGDTARIYFPAALLSLFTSDGQTWDVANPQAIALSVHMFVEGIVIPASNLGVTQINSGELLRRGSRVRDTYIAGSSFPNYRRGIVWADCRGLTTMTLLTSTSGAPDTMTALQGCSNAAITNYWEGPLNILVPATTTGPFGNVLTEVRFTCTDASGNQARITVPAPVDTLFLPDQRTIDMSNSLVAAFASAATSELVIPASDEPVTQVLYGFLYQSKQVGVR